MWRAIRRGMDGELIDLARARAIPARAPRLDGLLEEVAEVARELGIAPYLRPLRGGNAAQRYVAEAGAGARRERAVAARGRAHARVRGRVAVGEDGRMTDAGTGGAGGERLPTASEALISSRPSPAHDRL